MPPSALAALRAAFAGHPLGPALGWPAVHAFEAEHGVVLPELYRLFVATIGNGCADGPPSYGLVRLGEPADRRGDGAPLGCAITPGSPGRPFPLTAAWIWEDDPPDAVDTARLEAVARDGFVPLGTDGCGMDWVLVTSGPHRGIVWQITGEGAQPFGALFGYTTAEPGFAGWVAHWAAGRDWFDRPGAAPAPSERTT